MKNLLTLVGGVWYIDPVRFLESLEERVSLLTERIVVPGIDHVATEALRARRVELVALIQQLKEIK